MNLLIASFLCLVPVPDEAKAFENGIYVWKEKGPGDRVRRNDGAEVFLDRRLGGGFGKGTLASTANDNTRFWLDLKGIGPLPGDAEQGHLALMIDGICLPASTRSDRRADGTMDVSASVYGEEAAKKVAAHLKIEAKLRKHPGHRIAVQWTPEKEFFLVGEPVKLKMTIKNIGDVPFTFMAGGRQRGPARQPVPLPRLPPGRLRPRGARRRRSAQLRRHRLVPDAQGRRVVQPLDRPG